jgi:hypothetical protein
MHDMAADGSWYCSWPPLIPGVAGKVSGIVAMDLVTRGTAGAVDVSLFDIVTGSVRQGLGQVPRMCYAGGSCSLRAFAMKKIVFVLAAFALSAASHQALACDFGLHARNAAPTVATCDGSDCTPIPSTQESAAAPKVADETASSTPTTVAQK